MRKIDGDSKEVRRRLHEMQAEQIALEQQNQELCLRRNEVEAELENYTELYDFAPVGYCTLDRAGTIRNVNLSGASLLGEERSRLIDRSFCLFVSAESKPLLDEMLAMLFNGQQKKARCEVVIHPQGSRPPIPVNIVAMTSVTREECLAVIIDVSERTRLEAEALVAETEVELQRVREQTAELLALNRQLTQEIEGRNRLEATLFDSEAKLRNLSAYLQHVREEERKAIAREIHDELGQLLAAIQLGVSLLPSEYSDHDNLIVKTDELGLLIVDGIKTVQRISAQLRPAMLDILGLSAALEWQSQEFRKQTDIDCDIDVLLLNDAVQPNVATALFRIFQESLTNIRRHSQATKVDASLYELGQSYCLRVYDNGRGITSEELSSMQSLGLIGIRERVFILGGRIRIIGAPDRGTAVLVRVPVSPKEKWHAHR